MKSGPTERWRAREHFLGEAKPHTRPWKQGHQEWTYWQLEEVHKAWNVVVIHDDGTGALPAQVGLQMTHRLPNARVLPPVGVSPLNTFSAGKEIFSCGCRADLCPR